MVDRNLRTARIFATNVLVDEPTKAARFWRDTMGAVDVDREFCHAIAHLVEGEDNECERVTTGGLTLQFMKPSAALPGSVEFYNEHGSMVYSYQLFVDDVDAAVESLVAGGAHLIGAIDDGALALGTFFEGDSAKLVVVDALAQCGLIFEIMEKNGQVPCYTDKRFPGDVGVFQHSEVVVKDPAAARDWMVKVLGAEPVEQPIAKVIGTGSSCTGEEEDAAPAPAVDEIPYSGADTNPGCEHVLWGGYVFQLITPFPHLPGWLEHLQRHGNITHNICFHTHPTMTDIPTLLEDMENHGAKELKYEGDEHSESWNFAFSGLYGLDGDDPARTCWCVQVDVSAQCGLLLEFIPMCYRWNCSTGYFFD